MKISTTMRLSEEAKRLLAEIGKLNGLKSTAANEMIIREAARQRGIAVREGDKEPDEVQNA